LLEDELPESRVPRAVHERQELVENGLAVGARKRASARKELLCRCGDRFVGMGGQALRLLEGKLGKLDVPSFDASQERSGPLRPAEEDPQGGGTDGRGHGPDALEEGRAGLWNLALADRIENSSGKLGRSASGDDLEEILHDACIGPREVHKPPCCRYAALVAFGFIFHLRQKGGGNLGRVFFEYFAERQIH